MPQPPLSKGSVRQGEYNCLTLQSGPASVNSGAVTQGDESLSDSDSSTKTCPKCERELPATAEFFYQSKTGKYGLHSQCKDCRKKYGRVRRRENIERISAQQRAWRQAHPDYAKEWWAANTPDRGDYHQRHYNANRERRVEDSRLYRLEHPDYHAKFRQENSERYLAYGRNHRARKRENGGTHTGEDVKAQYDRQKGKCFYCHEKLKGQYEVDHVIPLSKGGSNGPENLVVACMTCNRSKAAKHPMDFCGRLL